MHETVAQYEVSERISMGEIQAIANRIAEKFDVVKIILFGSYAYGTPTSRITLRLHRMHIIHY